MGLHSKVRYEIVFKSENRITQKDEIEKFATGLYDFIFDFIGQISINTLRNRQKLFFLQAQVYHFSWLEST